MVALHSRAIYIVDWFSSARRAYQFLFNNDRSNPLFCSGSGDEEQSDQMETQKKGIKRKASDAGLGKNYNWTDFGSRTITI